MPRGVKKVVAEAAQNVVSKKVVPRKVVVRTGDEPKQTREQAVDNALSTIANHASSDQAGGALALLLRAAGINTADLARDLANEHALQSTQDRMPTQVKRSLGEPAAALPPTPPLEYSLDSLTNSIAAAHNTITQLTSVLQPFLQQHMFDDNEGQSADKADSDDYYAEHGSTLSPTLLSVNRAINEVTRLITRINYVRSNIVL